VRDPTAALLGDLLDRRQSTVGDHGGDDRQQLLVAGVDLGPPLEEERVRDSDPVSVVVRAEHVRFEARCSVAEDVGQPDDPIRQVRRVEPVKALKPPGRT
jgi:hypothetical protein